jgi:hypothetical protein
MYKRINILHRIFLSFFLLSLGVFIVNDSILKKRIPIEIVGYIFFLSLGIYVGFHVCLDELKRMNRKSGRV